MIDVTGSALSTFGWYNLFGFLLLHRALPDEILVQVLTVLVSVRCVTDTVGILICKSLESFRSGTVIVEKQWMRS